MTQNETMEASQLSVGWKQKTVAGDIDLTIARGEIVVLAGPNGAGKSTILKTLVKQLPPLAGCVKVNGIDLEQLNARQLASQVAYVPQFIDLGQDLTVDELVSLGRNPHQQWWSWTASQKDREAVDQALQRTEMIRLKDRYLSNLSGGEKQRAIIAMALAQQPVFMLLDEPTSHLDFRHQLELADLLIDLAKHGIGIGVVLHDLNLMARLADRILLLEKPGDEPSVVAASGARDEVLTPENLRRVYQVDVSILANPGGPPMYAFQ
jgi:iron complex transport system ATP-binding protein